MVDRLMSPAEWAELRAMRPAYLTELSDEWYKDSYECWTVNRPSGWADNTSVEAQAKVESGMGRLYASGPGGPQGGEMVITIESPYKFRTLASSGIDSGNLLIVNDDRLFRVDIAKREDKDDPLMDVHVTELFSTPMPEAPVTPPVEP